MNVYFDAFAKYVCATLIVALLLFLTKISICGALMRATTTIKKKKQDLIANSNLCAAQVEDERENEQFLWTCVISKSICPW